MPQIMPPSYVTVKSNSAVPTVAEQALADRLAWSADGGDPDAYPGPGWDGPSPEQEAEWLGLLLGADGVEAEYLSPDAAERAAFERGHNAGDDCLWASDLSYAAHLKQRAEDFAAMATRPPL